MFRLLLAVLAAFSHLSFAEIPSIDSLNSAYVQTISSRDATSVINHNGRLYIAKQGDLVFGHYRVKQVQDKYILIESDRAVIRLFLPSSSTNTIKPPEIFYRQRNEQPIYEAIPQENKETYQGEIQ